MYVMQRESKVVVPVDARGPEPLYMLVVMMDAIRRSRLRR